MSTIDEHLRIIENYQKNYRENDYFLNGYREFKNEGYKVLVNSNIYEIYMSIENEISRNKIIDQILQIHTKTPSEGLKIRLNEYFEELREKRVVSNRIVGKIDKKKGEIERAVVILDKKVNDKEFIRDFRERGILIQQLIALERLIDKLQINLDFLEDVYEEFYLTSIKIVENTAEGYSQIEEAFKDSA